VGEVGRPPRWRVNYERELAALLWKYGLVVCRSGASGGAKRRWPTADVLAWCPKTGTLWAIEVKAMSGARESADALKRALRQLSKSEREKLSELSKRGARPVLAVRFGGKWRGYEIEVADGMLVKRELRIPGDLCPGGLDLFT
jgi:Holliday junction resolvase